jgi:hypothetical protein
MITDITTNPATPYEYGYAAGKQLHPLYKLMYKLLGCFPKSNIVLDKDGKNQLINIEENSPTLYEELQGLSDSTKIKLNHLLSMQQRICNFYGGECTVTASTGKATLNNNAFITQNWDVNILNPVFHITRHIFTRNLRICNIEKHYKYAYLGIPILYEIPLLNEKGLGFGGNGTLVTKEKLRHIDTGDGTPSYEIIRQTMMQSKNIKEVEQFWKKSLRSSNKYKQYPHHWDYANTTWVDKNGDILMIEQTHKRIILVFRDSIDITGASEDILWHANHHQWLDPHKTGSVSPREHPSSVLRQQRARELLEEYYGKIDLDICKKITRDHKKGFNPNKKTSGDICRHPDHHSFKATIFAFILEPKKLTAHWTKGYPCKKHYTSVDFTDIL